MNIKVCDKCGKQDLEKSPVFRYVMQRVAKRRIGAVTIISFDSCEDCLVTLTNDLLSVFASEVEHLK